MIDVIREGGIIMWVLFGVGAVALMLFFERLFHLHRAQIRSHDFLKGIYNIMNRQNVAEAVSICDETPGPVARVVRAAVLHHDLPPEEIRRAIEDTGLSEIPRLEKNMNMIGSIAQVAPLLGLLGTVVGMIDLLFVTENGSALIQVGQYSGGMLKALFTTAMGLAISIPSYVAYNFLTGRIEALVLDMERASSEIYTFLVRRRQPPQKGDEG
jgi:biopolymer transport protein ExbB